MRIERILLPTLLATVATAQSWAPVLTQNAPPPQGFQQSLAWHAPSGRTLLYGGRTSAPLSETWLFDGTDWTLAQPVTDPGPRWGHRLVYDSRRGVVVLWGGRGAGTSAVAGTWEWNGTDWQQVPTATEPPLRAWHQMAFDQRRGVAVVFGGFSSTDTRTWEYDGVDWTAVQTATVPPTVGDGETVYDASRGVTVLFGGFANATGTYARTWEYDGLDWRQVATANDPGDRIRHQMSYDALRGHIVLLGGFASGAVRSDTWVYDGADWVAEAPVGTAPLVPLEGGMSYDAARDRHVYFGGRGPTGASGDTYEYFSVGRPSFATAGRGCAGSAGVPTLTAVAGSLPRAGTAFSAAVGNLPAGTSAVVVLFGLGNTSFGPFQLPLDLSFAGLPGCRLDHSNDASFAVPVTGTTASWTLQIPAGLDNVTFWNQAFVPDAGAGNALGGVLSDSARGYVTP